MHAIEGRYHALTKERTIFCAAKVLSRPCLSWVCDEKPLLRQRMHVFQRIATPASSLTENDVETGYVRIIVTDEDERLPTPISTHASMRWKVFCSVNKIVSGRPFLPP